MDVREVSESAFEFLIGEIISLEFATSLNIGSKELEINDSDLLYPKIERMGFDVGYKFVEVVALPQKHLGTDPLDIVKFICKDFWEEIFKKKVDKLQTNHRGVFVLSDHKFKWLDRYSSDDNASKQAAVRLLNFTCGLLRGALANLGLNVNVYADFITMPSCTFQIRIKA